MVTAKETAEEQLLRMIEGPQPVGAPKGPAAPVLLERLIGPLRQGGEWLRRWKERPSMRRPRSDAFLAQLQLTSQLFWTLLGGLGFYLLVDAVVFKPKTPRLP